MDALTAIYAAVMFLMGVLVSWPQTHNSAMFSEVGHHHTIKSLVLIDSAERICQAVDIGCCDRLLA